MMTEMDIFGGGGLIPVESVTLFYYKLSAIAGILFKHDTNPLRPYNLKVWGVDAWPLAGEYISITWDGSAWTATILKSGYYSTWDNGIYTDKVYKNVGESFSFAGLSSQTDLVNASKSVIAWA